ncbi:DUF4435 domain-containing protein [Acinetobacter sp. 1207_04]|uniref:DUF4435 domain-containing protein n=1 Tax=Acinetobacter sp. 1207_04 TaxID=2604449 RepID=UPI00405860C6
MGSMEISRLDFMDNMLNDESVIFQDFMNFYRDHENKVIFFLEGDDDIDYYLNKIQNKFGEYDNKWVEMSCAGRSNVVQIIKDLHEHTKQEYRNCKHFGIIDKDYNEVSDNEFPEKIYITPCYSIENFYVSKDFFKKVVNFKFHLNGKEERNNDFQRCLENFEYVRNDFIDKILELDKYLRCNRIMFDLKAIDSKINARQLKLGQLLDITLTGVELKSDVLGFMKKKIEDFNLEALKESNDFYLEKPHDDLAMLIRGKFMFYFITQYLYKLRNDNLNKNPQIFVDSSENDKKKGDDKVKMQKTKLSFNIENPDLFSALSDYADSPKCLVDFLENAANNTLESV